MILLILFAFIAGLVTILSPCILPILPIILSGSIDKGKKRPLGIVTGFILSFTFFTLFLSALVKFTGLPADALRNIAVVTVFVFGIFLLFPQTQVLLEQLLSKLSSKAPRFGNQGGFGSGLLIGLSLGLVWAPCVGPILASVITLAATSSVNAATFFITLAYSLGTAIPMIVIIFAGQNILQKTPWLLERASLIQKAFGVIMILTAMGLHFNIDRQFQTFILERFPQYGTGLTAFEDNEIVKKQLNNLRGTDGQQVFEKKAPDFIGGGEWINSEPLTLAEDLKGKVVLVDFWTYSCVNCVRTFPYLREWYEKYKDEDFVIVGVHSPEFEFEKKYENVKKASEDFELTYPIVQDNDFAIWQAYNNRYWPAHYLIDKEGVIRYTHFGEGNYVTTENKIRELLNQEPLDDADDKIQFSQKISPETYLGYNRAEQYIPELDIRLGVEKTYQAPSFIPENGVGLSGPWLVDYESITSKGNNTTLKINFTAASVNLVMSPSSAGSDKVMIKLDGRPLLDKIQTNDSKNSEILVTEPRLYGILKLEKIENHILELTFPNGTSAFAFTFSRN